MEGAFLLFDLIIRYGFLSQLFIFLLNKLKNLDYSIWIKINL